MNVNTAVVFLLWVEVFIDEITACLHSLSDFGPHNVVKTTVPSVLEHVSSKKAPEAVLYNILKGKHETGRRHGASPSQNKFPPFELCQIQSVVFMARIVYLDLSKRNIKVRVEAFTKSGKKIESYEVENYHIDPDEDNEKSLKNIKDLKICNSFKVEKIQMQRDVLFKIKFHHDGEWWCDVYNGYSFDYQEMDKCTVVENEYSAITDREYYAVDNPLQTKTKLGSNFWTECSLKDHPEETICKNEYTKTETKVRYFCHKSSKRLLGYKIVNYYENLELGTYTISNSETLKGKVDGNRVCRLFRFSMDNNDANTIHTQFLYFKRSLVSSAGEWKWYCQDFHLRTDGGSSYYILDPISAECKRFRNYDRPKSFDFLD